MYRGFPNPGELHRGAAPFGHPPHGLPTGPRYGGPFGPPPNTPPPRPLLPSPGAFRPFLPPGSNTEYLHNRPGRDLYVNTQPHFPIDRSAGINVGGQQSLQVPQWPPNEAHPKHKSDKAGEDFLRCLATNQPLPDYLKENIAFSMAEMGMSGSELPRVRSKSRSRSRAKSRARSKSRGRSKGRVDGASGHSRAKSRARSRSKSHERSRAKSKSRAHSRSRSRSRTRGKSRAQSKSRARSKTRARSKSRARSRQRSRSRSHGKSQGVVDESKISPSQNFSGSSSGSQPPAVKNDLLQGLKRVMNSKELEDRLPSIKDAILTIQAGGLGLSTGLEEPASSQDHAKQSENDSMLLPHERVGSDFSWLQSTREEDYGQSQKKEDEEDEESFLYGNGNDSERQLSMSGALPCAPQTQFMTPFNTHEGVAQMSKTDQYYQDQPLFRNLGELLGDLKPAGQASSSTATTRSEQMAKPPNSIPIPNVKECEKIKNMLKTIGLSLGTADISKMMSRLGEQQQKEERLMSPALPGQPQQQQQQKQQQQEQQQQQQSEVQPATSTMGTPNIRQALVSLQSLIKATKEKRAKIDQHGGSSHSQKTGDKRQDVDEGKRREAQMKRKEALVKELEGLLKDNDSGFLIPVIGFFCQKCEEFLGDLNTAESHAASHRRTDAATKHGEERDKRHLHHPSNHHHSADRRDLRDHHDHGDQRDNRDQRVHRDQRDHRHPELKRKMEDDPRGHRNNWEKIHVKEEKLETPRLTMTVVRGHTPPGPKKSRGREEEGRMEKGSGSSGPAVGKALRKDKESIGSRKEENGKDKKRDSDSQSSDSEAGKSPKSHKKDKDKKKKKKKKNKKNKK